MWVMSLPKSFMLLLLLLLLFSYTFNKNSSGYGQRNVIFGRSYAKVVTEKLERMQSLSKALSKDQDGYKEVQLVS